MMMEDGGTVIEKWRIVPMTPECFTLKGNCNIQKCFLHNLGVIKVWFNVPRKHQLAMPGKPT
jgi:hypothetical protein